MCNLICVVNPVKGVGKTSTAVNFAASLSLLEKKTLIVDCDPGANASKYLGLNPETYDFGLDDFLIGLVGSRGVVQKSEIEFLDCIPSGHDLESIEKNLALNPEKEKVLSIVTRKLTEDYDYILFDTPPDKGFITKSVLNAAESILIPEPWTPDSFDNIYNVLGFASDARTGLKVPLKLAGILFTMGDSIETPEEVFSDEKLKDFKNVIFPVTIPKSDIYDKSVVDGKPACLVDIKSDFSEAFLDLSYEFLYREKGSN